MARYTGPMTKKSRRLGVDLVGGDMAFERRPFPPGQHGRGRIRTQFLVEDAHRLAGEALVLREIAEVLNLHESTVSRVTTQKFMYTPRGIFELKYFFGSHVATDSGGACSATAIRALIKQLVQEENPRKPLSDNKISSILEQQGIVVARRTIAKYRESLQIPAANLRKSI